MFCTQERQNISLNGCVILYKSTPFLILTSNKTYFKSSKLKMGYEKPSVDKTMH